MTTPKMRKNGIFRPRGISKTDANGDTFWREHAEQPWMNAVYHNDIRDEFIAACAQQGQYSMVPFILIDWQDIKKLTKIEYPRESGTVPTDVTAFHKDQEDWGPERDQRPDILHQYDKRGHQNPTYPVPLLTHNGAIVLDYNNHPILDFNNMPMTFSSKLEGWLQEAMIRQDARIDVKDFRVRMEVDPKSIGSMSLPTLSAISMRRSRYRWRAGSLSWTHRTGSDDIKNYLDNLLPDECKASNSTKGFRDLKRSEVKLMTALNRNKHLQRAGTRSLSDRQRQKVDANFWKSVTAALNQEMEVEGSEVSSMDMKDSEDEEEIEDDEDIEDQITEDHDTEDHDTEDHDTEDHDTEDHGTEDHDTEDQGYEDQDTEDHHTEDQDTDPDFAQPPARDYRFVAPTTPEDMETLFHAMQSARKHYRKLTGEHPPNTVFNADYSNQWNTLQVSLIHWWRENVQNQPEPTLVQYVEPWTGRYPPINKTNRTLF